MYEASAAIIVRRKANRSMFAFRLMSCACLSDIFAVILSESVSAVVCCYDYFIVLVGSVRLLVAAARCAWFSRANTRCIRTRARLASSITTRWWTGEPGG